ncbi:MAG: CYTH and CHAD domain-containing protein [Burkholderiales bacterium]|nr:CYTH and CHAD domain-containing protein [Burkholderiales bacterium]
MQEIELKFQVPAARRAAVDAAVAGREKSPRIRLQAAYFDTPDRALAQAGMALRIRREGRRVVQTLKGLGNDGLTRAEHNVVLPPSGDPEALPDPSLHAGTAVGDRLIALLAKRKGPPLAMQFRTDIRRRSRQLRTRQGVVELAFDEGVIVAGDRRLAVCELEIELVRGSPLAVIATARQWVLRHGLWLDTRSKAERGDMLSRGESMAPQRKAGKVRLSEEMTMDDALRRMLLSCLDQIAVNSSQVASGEYVDEHVHQLRIGLRRLRSALRLVDVEAAMPAVTEQAAILFRRLGAARDRAAVAEPLEQGLREALAASGLEFDAPRLPLREEADPTDIVRFGPAQVLILELYEWTQGRVASPSPPPSPQRGEGAIPDASCIDDAPRYPAAPSPLWGEGGGEGADLQTRDILVKGLKRLHRQVITDLKNFDTLKDVARHRLRKRAKRLRYGTEFAASFLEKRKVRRYLDAMQQMQDALGAYVDVTVAMQAYKSQSDKDPRILFALGWLAARKKALIADIPRIAKVFRQAPRIWRDRS